MVYLDKTGLFQSMKLNHTYERMIDTMRDEVIDFCEHFEDDPSRVSRWGHLYFCEKDGGALIFDLKRPKEHVCEICNTVYTGEPFDGIWHYNYRNEAANTVWKAGLIYTLENRQVYLEYIEKIVGYYAKNYLSFALHNKEGRHYDNYETMQWGCGRLMPQGLNESIFTIRMLNGLELVKDQLSQGFLHQVKTLMLDHIVALLKPQVDKIHNISCWKNSAIGAIGLFLGEDALVDFAYQGEYGLVNQIQKGVTPDGFWYEGSIHYNFFTLEGITQFALFATLYDFDIKTLLPTLHDMFVSGYHYAFDNHQLPNPNDGWPNINLKTYSYIYTVATKIFGYDSDIANILKHIESGDKPRGMLPLSKPYYFENTIPLERLALIPDFDCEHKTSIDTTSRNFEGSQYAILKNKDVNVFYKYGHNGPSHAHPDKMNIEVILKGETFSRDLSNAGYGATLCNEWHRVSASHNTVVINGLNHVSMERGKTLAFTESSISAMAEDVYQVPKNLDIEKMKRTMNQDEIIKYLVRYLSVSESEAFEAIKQGKDLTEIVETAVKKAVKVDFIREIALISDGLTDIFTVKTNQAVTADYIFHVESPLVSFHHTEEASLGFNDFGYQHIKAVKEVKHEGSSVDLVFQMKDFEATMTLDLTDKTLFLAKTYDNPITKDRQTIILRSHQASPVFKMQLKIT